MALKRDQIAPPALPMEAVEVPELGGEVIVRGLLLRDRLALVDRDSGDAYDRIARMLAGTVVDADQKPIWSAAQWEEFGGAHPARALELFERARRLSGLDDAAAKKK